MHSQSLDIDQFARVKANLMAHNQPYPKSELKTPWFEIYTFLEDSGLFEQAKLHGRKSPITRDPERLLQFLFLPTSSALTRTQLRRTLERVWLEELCLPIEAHTLTCTDDEIMLDFVTATDARDGYYFTGSITVDTSGLRSGNRQIP